MIATCNLPTSNIPNQYLLLKEKIMVVVELLIYIPSVIGSGPEEVFPSVYPHFSWFLSCQVPTKLPDLDFDIFPVTDQFC